MESLDFAGLSCCWSGPERSVTSMKGSLMGVEQGDTDTEPFLVGKAVAMLYESSGVV